MGTHIRSAALGGVVGGLVVAMMFLALGSGPWFGRTSAVGASESGTVLTHEEMHQMMDAVHGPGASERMHEAMGPDAEEMMDQCVAMMNRMNGMMEAGGMMNGMMGNRGMMNMMRGMRGQQ